MLVVLSIVLATGEVCVLLCGTVRRCLFVRRGGECSVVRPPVHPYRADPAVQHRARGGDAARWRLRVGPAGAGQSLTGGCGPRRSCAASCHVIVHFCIFLRREYEEGCHN